MVRELSAEDRSWVGMIVQAGIKGFVTWYRDHGDSSTVATDADSAIAAQVFGAAPRALAGVINLQQTVELVRLTIDVVESNVDEILLRRRPARRVHDGLLRYGRELAFATAEVYARAAEVRGAWDARLEALVVDSVLRADADATVLSRAGALGWAAHGEVVVVLGARPRPGGRRPRSSTTYAGSARAAGVDALCAHPGRPAGRRARPAWTDPEPGRTSGAAPLRRWSGGGRSGRSRPRRRRTVPPRAALAGAPRRAGLAGGAASGRGRRPAAGAGPGR